MFRIIGGFIGANWKFLLPALFVIGMVWAVASCQGRGEAIITLKEIVLRKDSLIRRKDDTLFAVRRQVDYLKDDAARLAKNLSDTQIQVLQLKGQLSAGEKAALLADQAIAAGKRQVNRLVDALSESQVKQVADQGLKDNDLSYVSPAPDQSDTATYRRIAKLTEYGKVYHDSTQALKKRVGQQGEEIVQLKGKNSQLTDQVSDLERNLNGLNNAAADRVEEVLKKKPFLNVGLGKKTQKAANDIRAGRFNAKK